MVPGNSWIAYMGAAAGAGETPQCSAQSGAYQLKSAVGTLKLALAESTLAMPRTPVQEVRKLSVPLPMIVKMLHMLDANYVSALQIAYPEMLGITLSKQGCYSMSLQALLRVRAESCQGFDLPPDPVILPEPFVRMLDVAIKGYSPAGPIDIHHAPGRVWTTIERTSFGTTYAEPAHWLELTKVTDQLKGVARVEPPIYLGALRDRQNLFNLASAEQLQLGPQGARAISASSEYCWEGVQAPTEVRLPFEKTMKLLPLTPQLSCIAPNLILMEGPDIEAFVSTRV